MKRVNNLQEAIENAIRLTTKRKQARISRKHNSKCRQLVVGIK